MHLGVELVQDRDSKKLFSEEANLFDRFKEAWHEVRLNMRLNTSGFPICPPLCVSKDEVDEVVDKLGYGVRKVSEQLGIG